MEESELREQYKSSMRNIKDAMYSFPWESQKAYEYWLAQTFFFVKHSTRLLAMGSAFSGFEHEDIHRRMIDHLKEEQGHEYLAVNDLKVLVLLHPQCPF